MFYGANVWDPLLIISQIVSLQTLSYLSLGLLQWIIISPYHSGHLSLNYFFDWRYVNVHSFTGWLTVATHLLNSVLCAFYLLLLVGRAKKCLDFAATFYIWHAVFTISTSGFPKGVVWWVSLLSDLAVMALLGEWICLQREMRDIPINSLRSRPRSSNDGTRNAAPAAPAGTGTKTSGSSNLRPSNAGIAMTSRGATSMMSREGSTKDSSSAPRETTRLLADAV